MSSNLRLDDSPCLSSVLKTWVVGVVDGGGSMCSLLLGGATSNSRYSLLGAGSSAGLSPSLCWTEATIHVLSCSNCDSRKAHIEVCMRLSVVMGVMCEAAKFSLVKSICTGCSTDTTASSWKSVPSAEASVIASGM